MSNSTQLAQHPGIFKRIILRAAKLPIIYIILGTMLIGVGTIDDYFSLLPLWQGVIDVCDKLGNVFIALAIMTFIYNCFVYICVWYEQKLEQMHKIATLVLASIRKGSRVIYFLVAINLIIHIIAPPKDYLSYLTHSFNILIIGSISWMLLEIINTFEAAIYQYMLSLTSQDSIRVSSLYTKVRIGKNIFTVLIFILAGAAILMTFEGGRNIGVSILASAGFITAIIGLSAQKTLFSLFSGLQIAVSQPIKIGDMVVIENASGTIEEITFTYVTIKLGDKRRLIVPINYFIEKQFENWSREGESLRSGIFIYVDYMMPIDALRQELDRILESSPYWDKHARRLQVNDVKEHSVELRITISASNSDNLAELRSEVRERMLLFIRENYAEYLPNTRQSTVQTGLNNVELK